MDNNKIDVIEKKIDILAKRENALGRATGEIYDIVRKINARMSPPKPKYVEKNPLKGYVVSDVPIPTEWNIFREYKLYPPEVGIGFMSPLGIIDMFSDYVSGLAGFSEEIIGSLFSPQPYYGGYKNDKLIEYEARRRAYKDFDDSIGLNKDAHDEIIETAGNEHYLELKELGKEASKLTEGLQPGFQPHVSKGKIYPVRG